MKKGFWLILLTFSFIGCALAPLGYQNKIEKYFIQNPDRIEFKTAIEDKQIVEGMTKQEVKLSLQNTIMAPTWQEKQGYYKDIGCSSYWLVGSYKGQAPNMWFDAYMVIFFEDNKCVGWQDI